jgi:hypothetical protein
MKKSIVYTIISFIFFILLYALGYANTSGDIYMPVDEYFVSRQNSTVLLQRSKVRPSLMYRITGKPDIKIEFYYVAKDRKLHYLDDYNDIHLTLSKSGSHIYAIDEKTVLLGDKCKIVVLGEKKNYDFTDLNKKLCRNNSIVSIRSILQTDKDSLYLMLHVGSHEEIGVGKVIFKLDSKGNVISELKLNVGSPMHVYKFKNYLFTAENTISYCLNKNLEKTHVINSNLRWVDAYINNNYVFKGKLLSSELNIWKYDEETCFKEHSKIQIAQGDNVIAILNQFNDDRLFLFSYPDNKICYVDYKTEKFNTECLPTSKEINYLYKLEDDLYEAVLYKEGVFGYYSMKFRVMKPGSLMIVEDWKKKRFNF